MPRKNAVTFVALLTLIFTLSVGSGANADQEDQQATTNPTQPSTDNGVVYLGGKLKRPGVYSIAHHPTNLLQIIYSAALDDDLDTDHAVLLLIRRTGPTTQTSTTYVMKGLMAGNPDPPLLQDGDIVQVSKQP